MLIFTKLQVLVGLFSIFVSNGVLFSQFQTEIVLLTQKKNQLLAAEAEDEQRQSRLKELQDERDCLLLARDLLQQQRERERTNSPRNSGEDWVIIPRQEGS